MAEPNYKMNPPDDLESGLANSTYEIFIVSTTVWSLGVILLMMFVPLPTAVRQVLMVVDYGICIVFMVDFLRSLRRAPNMMRYFLRGGWLDLLGSIPSLPLLRLLRIGRIFSSLRALHGVPVREVLRRVREERAQSTMLGMLFLIIFILTVSASVVGVAEGLAPDANIMDGYDAFWWAFVTVTTVGYGDYYPVTDVGRVFAGLLMLVGVGLFTILTSFIASMFLKPGQRHDSDQIEELKRELADIKEMLREQQK